MKYEIEKNKYKIGERIRKQRKEIGKNQADFAEALGMQFESRSSISKWENGTEMPSLNNLLKMCEIFNCEIGYLLCEPGFDLPTRKSTDIQETTGLSQKAITTLTTLRTYIKGYHCPLNPILEHESLTELLSVIQNHVWSYNRGHYRIEDEKPETIEALANTFNCEPSDLKKYIETSSQSLIESTLMKIVNDIK